MGCLGKGGGKSNGMGDHNYSLGSQGKIGHKMGGGVGGAVTSIDSTPTGKTETRAAQPAGRGVPKMPSTHKAKPY